MELILINNVKRSKKLKNFLEIEIKYQMIFGEFV